MRRLVSVFCVLVICTGCGLLPTKLKRLNPPSTFKPNGPLTDICLKVEVADYREDQTIYMQGAFNIIRVDAEDHINFMRSEFEMAAAARGAEVGWCWNQDHLNKRTMHVAIRDLIVDSAWGWPITAHEFDVALDVEVGNDLKTMKHELKKNLSWRWWLPGHFNFDIELGTFLEFFSLEIRELIESFYDTPQVTAFLKENIKLPDSSTTAQKSIADQPDKKAQGSPISDISKKLTTLFEMKKEGLITDEEYTRLKEKTISSY